MNSRPQIEAWVTSCGVAVVLYDLGKRALDERRRVSCQMEAFKRPTLELMVQRDVSSSDSLCEPGFDVETEPKVASPEHVTAYRIYISDARYDELMSKGALVTRSAIDRIEIAYADAFG